MKRLSAVILLFIFATALLYAGEGKKLGKDLTIKEKTKIADILKDPASFEGKKVLIEGTITAVCQEKGCWIEVAGAAEGEKIKVKVTDGDIVFPKDAKGKTAWVEGNVYSELMDKKDAECKDEKKDDGKKACCAAKKESEKIYQIEGLGAVIK